MGATIRAKVCDPEATVTKELALPAVAGCRVARQAGEKWRHNGRLHAK